MVGLLLTNLSAPTEGVIHERPSTKLFISEREIGCGTLYITESKLSWRNDVGEKGLSLLYPHIAVHAISRDVQKFGSECMILMVENTGLDNDIDVNEEDEGSDDESGGMTQLRFVPEDKSQLDAMYQAMTHCQAQHPDPQDSFSEDDAYLDADDDRDDPLAGGDDAYIEGHDPLDQSNGIAALNGLNINNHQGDEEMETDGQFEDAEDD